MKRAALHIAVALAALPQASIAQFAPPSGTAQRQTPPSTQICVECHGAQGQGNPAAGFPRIAGQSQRYLAKQLESYADGSRRNPVMEPIAKSLSPQQIAELATFYAQTDAPVAEAPTGPAQPTERGRVLATRGDPLRRVQACDNCHGPGGVGQPPTIPYIGGLDANYIGATLNAWKNGTRRNDAGRQMATVAKALAEEDIAAVAQYYASLPPPAPASLDLIQPPPPQKKPPPAATPSVTQPPAAQRGRGTGAEQGAPTTGGTLGEGDSGASERPPAGGAPGAGGRGADGQSRRDGDPARGRAILASGVHGCIACHTIPGIRGARGIVGPPLGGIARRAFIAGQLPNAPETLVAFLQNPPALVPRTGMPDVGLTPEEARDIAAYLYTLEGADAR